MPKVQLVLLDGARPDSLAACHDPVIDQLLENSWYSLTARTVMPSVTLPCHMSLFHSVDPSRHGILSNTYVPQVRPVEGLFEVIRKEKRTGFFYSWEELRDCARPGKVSETVFVSGHDFGYEEANRRLTAASIKAMAEDNLDFTFTYLGWPDEAGHSHGWMSKEYLHSIKESFACVKQLVDSQPEDCMTIITADHGGHERSHGTELPEDMTIPVIFCGKGLKGQIEGPVSILDLAPTIAGLLGCAPGEEWEGKRLL